MSRGTASFSFVASGTQTIILGSFLPTWAEIYALDDENISIGSIAGGAQGVSWKFQDGANKDSDFNNSDCVYLASNATGATPRLQAQFTGFTKPGATGRIVFNVSNWSSGKPMRIVYGD